MWIEDMYQYPKEHPTKTCKMCSYARRCLCSILWKSCEDYREKYNSQEEYDKKESKDMREKYWDNKKE